MNGRYEHFLQECSLEAVMQAGRWKSHRMPMRYGEHVLAGLGAMARAAQAQGRVDT